MTTDACQQSSETPRPHRRPRIALLRAPVADVADRLQATRPTDETGVALALASVAVAAVLSLAVGVASPAAGAVVMLVAALVVVVRGHLLPDALVGAWRALGRRRGRADPRKEPAPQRPEPQRPEPQPSGAQQPSEPPPVPGSRARPRPPPPADVETILRSAGALVDDPEGDVALAPAFRRDWHAAMVDRGARGAEAAAFAALLDLDPARVEAGWRGQAFVARVDGDPVGLWESRAAFVADLTAADLLAERAAVWPALGPADRRTVLRGLRALLRDCPTCDGRVALAGVGPGPTPDGVAVACRDCDALLLVTAVERPPV